MVLTAHRWRKVSKYTERSRKVAQGLADESGVPILLCIDPWHPETIIFIAQSDYDQMSKQNTLTITETIQPSK